MKEKKRKVLVSRLQRQKKMKMQEMTAETTEVDKQMLNLNLLNCIVI